MEWPLRAVRRSLTDLRTFSSCQASKVATREFRFLSFRDIYSDTCARGERANWGGASMRDVRGGHFWQLGSIASPAIKTTGGVILVAFWPKHGLRSDLRVPNLKFFLGEHAPRPP